MDNRINKASASANASIGVCRLPTCKTEYEMKRKDMGFCCHACKKEFYRLAYRMGIQAMEVLR